MSTRKPAARRSAAKRSATTKAAPLVGVVMGSKSDWEVMREACAMLADSL